MRWRIHYLAVRQHAGRIAQPDRIPVGFDLPRGGPARARPAVKLLKRRWIQEQCSHLCPLEPGSYWPEAAAANDSEGPPARETSWNRTINSALPTTRVSTMLQILLGIATPSCISYSRTNSIRRRKMEGFFTRRPASRT